MNLNLHRYKLSAKAALGKLDIDGVFECFTLEDIVRVDPNPSTPENEAKVYGQTAIPAMTYSLAIDFSPRFQKNMIHVLDVPGFTGIRIHSGNTDHDTLGCILVGQKVINDDYIQGGSQALPILFAKIQVALNRGDKVLLTITDDFQEA